MTAYRPRGLAVTYDFYNGHRCALGFLPSAQPVSSSGSGSAQQFGTVGSTKGVPKSDPDVCPLL